VFQAPQFLENFLGGQPIGLAVATRKKERVAQNVSIQDWVNRFVLGSDTEVFAEKLGTKWELTLQKLFHCPEWKVRVPLFGITGKNRRALARFMKSIETARFVIESSRDKTFLRKVIRGFAEKSGIRPKHLIIFFEEVGK
jgi:hypothetical protein